MLSPLARAFDQLADPAILRVLATSLVLSAACFGLLCGGAAYEVHHALAGLHWAGWHWLAPLAAALGGALVLLAALWLFLPVAVLLASLFTGPVCRAVERRWYPGLPPARGATLPAQLWDGLVVASLVLVLTLAGLLLAVLLPGIGLVAGWAITAWALGRGLFVAVAMRRMDRHEAERLYRQHRPAVLLQGAGLALLGSVPVANLLVPVLGCAAMVHVLMRQAGGTDAPFVRRG